MDLLLSPRRVSVSLALPLVFFLGACPPAARPCDTSADCDEGQVCAIGASSDGVCIDDETGSEPKQDGGAPDSGAPDSGAPDSGAPDSGTPDSGTPDSGTPDSGTPDSGMADAGYDAGAPDAGAPDSGLADGGFDAGHPDAGPPPPYDLDSITRPSDVDDAQGTPYVHRVTNADDPEDWFVAEPYSNNQQNFLYVGLVCEGTGTDNVRARLRKDLNAPSVSHVGCGEDVQITTLGGTISGQNDYYAQVYVVDPALETDVRFNVYVTLQQPLPAAVTGVEAPIVELAPPSETVAVHDFDSLTAPSETGPQGNLIVHDVSYPDGDDEDWFEARIETNNQQHWAEGTLTCIGVEGTPSPSPIRAQLYRDDEPTSVSIFCNETTRHYGSGSSAVQPTDNLHWRVHVNPNGVTPPARVEYTIY